MSGCIHEKAKSQKPKTTLLVAYGFWLCAALFAQQAARDNAPASVGTATIAGKILLDRDTKQPARRVRVTLNEVAASVAGRTTTTDDSGAFTFDHVPAGRFELKAIKDAYLISSYGASRPARAGTAIVVKDGQQINDVSIVIVRGGVITGTVRDVHGHAVPAITVRVLQFGYNAATGERTLRYPTSAGENVTDDRGEYRAYGLPPGNYIVLANPVSPRGRTPAPEDDVRILTSADTQRALQAARANGSAAATTTSATTRSSAAPPAPLVNYAPVFYPGVTDIGSATTITLGLSEERTGIDVTVVYMPTAKITGTLAVPPGVQATGVSLVPSGAQAELLAGAGLRGASSSTMQDGTFMFSAVPPGVYKLKSNTGEMGRGTGPNGPALWASEEVVMSGQDLNVPLTLRPGLTVTGHVVFEGTRPSPADLQTMSFTLVPPGAGGVRQAGSGIGGRVDADGQFTITSVAPNSYQFVQAWTAPGVSSRWALKSSVANGRDAFDAPLVVNPNDAVDWTVTFTDKPTGISGVFQDPAGRPATDYFVLVFSTDQRFWTPGSRRIRMMRPSTDGAFSALGLPPGEYFLAALNDLEPGEWNDPSLLANIMGTSPIKVTLRDGAITRQDIRLGGGH